MSKRSSTTTSVAGRPCSRSTTSVAPLASASRPPAPSPAAPSGVAVRMLTSGTTGPPKRVDLGYEMFERVMQGAKHYESNQDAALRLREGVVIVNAPLVHLGGLFRVLQAVLDGRRIALLERFTVDGWAEAVRRYHPKTVSLVPTALRMVLDADLDPADLAGVRSVMSGTAPLDPDVAEAFTAKYGVPVLTSYAATEFGGGVAGWNLADHREFAAVKRGSVGRAHAGCDLRVVDQASGAPLESDAVGLLEVRAAQLGGTEWIRTTDLARLDADGFLWIVGRADETILRGGMKIQPDVVRTALERDPAVRAAAVIGVDDERLGQVPVAAVELRDGCTATPGELIDRAPCAPRPVRATRRAAHRRRVAPDAVGQGRARRCARPVRDRSAHGRGVAAMERWTFGEAPLPELEALASGAPRPHEYGAGARAAERGAPPSHRRGPSGPGPTGGRAAPAIFDPGWAPTPAPISASTSTTRATSVTTTRVFLGLRARVCRRPRLRVRSSFRSPTRAHRASSTVASSRSSSIACSNSSTATSASRGRR